MEFFSLSSSSPFATYIKGYGAGITTLQSLNVVITATDITNAKPEAIAKIRTY